MTPHNVVKKQPSRILHPKSATDDKVKDLLSYLEEVENEVHSIKPIHRFNQLDYNNTISSPTAQKSKIVDSDLKAKFVALEVEVDDKTKTIHLLEKALKEQKTREQELTMKRLTFVLI